MQLSPPLLSEQSFGPRLWVSRFVWWLNLVPRGFLCLAWAAGAVAARTGPCNQAALLLLRAPPPMFFLQRAGEAATSALRARVGFQKLGDPFV